VGKSWTRLKLGSCSLREHSRIKREESAQCADCYARTGLPHLLLLWSGIRQTIRMGPTKQGGSASNVGP
jgi:hypothetical protein